MADAVPLARQVVTGDDALPGEARIIEAAERVLSGERRGVRAVLPFLGPAFIAAVAYIDPGNFATNMAGGSRFGYMLLWVVLAANLMAMLVQSMSAKLGIATGRSLPEVCRDRFPRRVVVLLWLQAEAVAMRWPRGSPPHAWARCPARWSCRASSTARSRSSRAGRSP